MTRRGQLDLYRAGFDAGRRDQCATDMGVIAAALRRAAEQRQRELLTQVIDILARAILGDDQDQEAT